MLTIFGIALRLAEAYSRREETLGVIRCDTFAAEIINPVVEFFYYNTVAKCALFQIIEQAIDKSHNLFSPNLSTTLIYAIGLPEVWNKSSPYRKKCFVELA